MQSGIETGHLRLAYAYLTEAALMDLDDLEHNTRDGLHIASLAGTWMALVAGFGGLRHYDDGARFAASSTASIRCRYVCLASTSARPAAAIFSRSDSCFR